MSRTSDVTLASSTEIRDRGSTFIGHVYRARTGEEARAVLGRHRYGRGRERHAGEDSDGAVNVTADKDKGESNKGAAYRDASGPHLIAAWRCMAVKPGRTGLGGPDDFTVQDGCDDGGERWAGGRVLGVMQREGVIDAVVIVCRWFGGTLLGPVRFTHIETCASEVCRRFKKVEEMDECVQTLKILDDLLAALRTELAAAREQSGEANAADKSAARTPDYQAMQDALDLTKAKRLIRARENSIKATKTLIEKCKTSE